MSVTYKALFTSAAGFNPTLPSGIIDMSIPLDWISGDIDSRHLYELTRAERDEWWYRFRRFRIPLSITGPNTLDFDFEVTRKMLLGDPITDEHVLRKPGMGFLHEATHLSSVDGAFIYTGEQTITGFNGNPANTAICGCTISMFRKIWEVSGPFAVEHYPMHAKGVDKWIPYIHVDIAIAVEADDDYLITIESTDVVGDYFGSFCPGHGGGFMELDVHSDGPDLFQPDTLTMDITPAATDAFFSWAGRYNVDTGE